MRRSPTVILALAMLAPVAVGAASSVGTNDVGDEPEGNEGTKRVVFVGNNWEGTVDVVTFDPGEGDLSHVATLNAIPDIEERRQEIYTDPERLGYFLGIRMLVGEGNDQYVDDMYSVNNGTELVISRPSLADVVSLNISTGEIEWRFEVAGQRSDHMAISPDGQRVAVSASTGNVTHILDVDNGSEIWRFPSGDSPHENVYSEDGSRIFHASIGRVYTPTDRPPLQDATKGHQVFQIVDTESREVLERVDMGEELERAGHPNMSSAVRPMTLTPDERYAYLQVSFFHGYIKYDLQKMEVVDVVELPNRVPNTPREQYLLDSAHHGITLNEAGTKLCVSGTMSDYAAIVPVDDPRDHNLHIKDDGKSYWSTLTDDGQHCLVSWSGIDRVSVFSFESEEEVDAIQVRDHPQRVRTGEVQADWYRAQVTG